MFLVRSVCLFYIGLLLPFTVYGDVNLYGAVRMSVDVIDDSSQRNTGISSNLSHFGIKGNHKISDSLQGEFKIEMGFDASGETGDLPARWRYLGIKGHVGSLRVGNLPTPFRILGRFFDEFPETIAENRGVLGLSASGAPKYDLWSANTVNYTSPNKNGLQAIVSYSSAYKGGSTPTGMDDNDQSMSGLNIHYADKRRHIRVAYETHEEDNSNGIRIAARYRFAETRLGFVYESIDAGLANKLTRDAYGFNVAHSINEMTYKTQLLIANDYEGQSDSGATNVNVGAFKKLDKHMALYVVYATTRNDKNAKYTVASAGHNGDLIRPAVSGDDIEAISIGGAYSF